MVVTFLEANFLLRVYSEVAQRGMVRPRSIELLVRAAFWQGYVILEGFEPVRKMNQAREASPKRTKCFLLELDLLEGFLCCFFIFC